MKNQNSNIVFVAILSAFVTFVSTVAFFANKEANREAKEDTNKEKYEPKLILISQYQLQKQYGWKDIILWDESKENFEKAYTTKLNWMNYAMGFQRDSTCSEPFGGGGEWRYEKICFHFVLRPDLPKMLDEMSLQSKGKILVVIGSIHNNNQRFSGNAYWCE